MMLERPPAAEVWHALESEKVAQRLGSDLKVGLSGLAAARRLSTHGPNELPETPPTSLYHIFLSQFSSLIIWVLIGAAVVSAGLQEWLDAGAILAIVALNALTGFIQEYKA